MILKSITPRHLGPFAEATKLFVEPDVTVLTGPNDVGKSFALRALALLCTSRSADERERNLDRIGEFAGSWSDDPDMQCDAVFEITEIATTGGYVPKDVQIEDELRIRTRVNTKGRDYNVIELRRGRGRVTSRHQIKRLPNIVQLPLETEIRETIDLRQMNAAEDEFIRLGFGPKFTPEQHTSLSDISRTFRIGDAEAKLNARLADILPPSLPLKFSLREVSGKPEVIGLTLIDAHRGHAPLGSRGAGVRRLASVMGALLRVDASNEHTIVLYDEPETSLHADAQHMLRRVLESLGAAPGIQVVYTTHSPAMINTLRPHSIRVIERRRVNDKATSVFVNQVLTGNYSLVRTSLGISPADSLLYAPITVIVEGATEIACLPLVLKKLAEGGLIDVGQLDVLLPQTHILDGEGASFEYMCRLAKSQNARPIVFLDGDKPGDAQKIADQHPDVPMISLPAGFEFEGVVPASRYISAAAAILEDDSGQMTEEAFREWESNQSPPLRSTVMFSKRVERWLRDVFDKPLYKPLVMRKAVEFAAPSDIQAAPFVQLFNEMKKTGNLI